MKKLCIVYGYSVFMDQPVAEKTIGWQELCFILV